MPFTQKFGTMFRKVNKNVNILLLNNGLTYHDYNKKFDLLHKKKIANGNYSFADVWFDLNNDDTIYGLINSKTGTLEHIFINDKFLIRSNILKYDSSIYNIKFPYIKKINNTTHIIYFLIDGNNPLSCNLIHHYYKDGKWTKKQLDNLSFSILSNFVINMDTSTLNIFYFKIIDGFEELFVSRFDLRNNIWSSPIQVTDSHKGKIYLSVICDSKGCYHIVFSENNSNQYFCTYISGYINESQFVNSTYKVIRNSVACTFPNIIEHDNIIYIQWIEYHNLYQSFSNDLGANWSQPTLDDKSSKFPFSSYSYHSNCMEDKSYSLTNIFILDNSAEILGIDNQ